MKKAVFIISLVLLIDQISKIYVKTHFAMGDSINILGFDWAQIYFTENKGAAWGTQLSDFITFLSESQAKIILTVFRLFAISGIGYWLYKSIKENAPKVLIIAVSMIFAGAIGNLIDSIFYGLIFEESLRSTGNIAQFSSEGYAGLFHGRVVDMLYFPMWSGVLPEWLPFWGGKHFTFFNAIFNIADMAISIGVGLFILFNKTVFPKE